MVLLDVYAKYIYIHVYGYILYVKILKTIRTVPNLCDAWVNLISFINAMSSMYPR